MYCIDSLLKEHENIAEFSNIVKGICLDIFNGKEIELDDIEKIYIFMNDYASEYHHVKEEKFLFHQIMEHLPVIGEKLIKFGMNIEHNFGRLYLSDIFKFLQNYKSTGSRESLLNIVSNFMCYIKLIERHIEKENNAIYKFSYKNLDKCILQKISQDSKNFDEQMIENINCSKEILCYFKNKYKV